MVHIITVLGLTAFEHRVFGSKEPWVVVLAGIHGEEPAPVVAVHSMLPIIDKWPFPFLIIPNANPAGIVKGKRLPEWSENASPLADIVFREELNDGRDIRLMLDLHEDSSAAGPYLFGHGGGVSVVYLRNLLYAAGVDFPADLKAWWEKDEPVLPIEGGIVWEYQDESIDDLVATAGADVVVVETPTTWELDRRVGLHARILAAVPDLYKMLTNAA